MARASKAQLIDSVVTSINAAGWSVELLSPIGNHPMRLAMERDGVREIVRIYIWNLTHGGGQRSKHEFRVQITGIESFELEPDGKTLILGWSNGFGAFAAFDAGRRTGPLGSSPSIQVLETTLTAGAADGAALQSKGDGEFALAVRPDRLASYVQHQAAAHAGDIGSIVADSESEGYSDDQVIDAAIADLGQHQFGSAEEIEQRRAILLRLEALEAEVVRLRYADGRGHNNPPELLPAEDIATVTELEEEASSLKGELAKVEPDVARVGQSARWFRQFVNTWRHVQSEAVKFAGKIGDKARDKAAELVLGTLVGGAAGFGQIVHLAEGLFKAIIKWLGLV